MEENIVERIDNACKLFTYPSTRQQGENELLTINQSLSPNDIPLVTLLVLSEFISAQTINC